MNGLSQLNLIVRWHWYNNFKMSAAHSVCECCREFITRQHLCTGTVLSYTNLLALAPHQRDKNDCVDVVHICSLKVRSSSRTKTKIFKIS